MNVYIVGSLDNIEIIRDIAKALRQTYLFADVNDSWTSHGATPDIEYCRWAKECGLNYRDAIRHPIARATFEIDKKFIQKAHIVICVRPCGKSASMELGYACGINRVTAILKNISSESYDKVEIMDNFADFIFNDLDELLNNLHLLIDQSKFRNKVIF